MNRRNFSIRLIGSSLAALALDGSARAQQGSAPAEGVQFARVEPPVPTSATGKVEVLEFFSYACPHCSEFEPILEAWGKKLAPDVIFRRVPVPFLVNAENFMRAYYALETLGQVDALQRKVFAAVHVERLRLDKPADFAALMAKNGVDAAKFLDVFNSFSVATSVNRAKKLVAAYKLESVPTVAVHGRYTTSAAQAGGPARAMAVVDYLIQRSRKA